MLINYKLFLKCLLSNVSYCFISHKIHEKRTHNIFLASEKLYFLSLHLRFSTMFYGCQFVDIFGYEIPYSSSNYNEQKSSVISVHNFHSLRNQDRLLVFSYSNTGILYSISELFSAGNWLEREAHEMHGVSFNGKKDIRNLMLQYGDSSSPLKKSFPSIGLREMFYDPIKDIVIQNPVSIQI